jgi:predicted permease
MSSLLGDVRYSLRSLAAQPGFVVVAVLSLTVGIGVNTAIFSAVNALLLRPIAVRDLDRSVIVFHASSERSDRGTSFPAYQHYRARTEIFDDMMAFSAPRPLLWLENDTRHQVYAEIVSAGFFRIADIRIQAGRPFDDDIDRRTDRQYVAVLSHAFWERRFASNPAVIGQPINLNGQPFIVTGIAAPGFTGLDAEVSADLWIPMTTWAHLIGEPGRLTGSEHWMTTIGQLKEGVTMAQAQAAMAVAGRQLHQPPGEQTRVRSVHERSMESVTDAVIIGSGAFVLGLMVLALACTNIANLLLARAAARQREMAIRTALGGSRVRLIRLWVVDSLLLCSTAGGLGLLVAGWILGAAVGFKLPVEIGQPALPTLNFHLDLRVFVFAIGLSLFTAVAIGLVAGLQGSRPGVKRFAPGFNLRSGIIALQMALALILLIPCGLFVRSALNASSVAAGFNTDNVLLLPVSANQAGVRVQKPPGFEQQLADRVSALPGVEAATLMDPVPLWFGGNNAHFSIDDGPSASAHRLAWSRIGTKYFNTLRIALLAGREFTAADSDSAPRVAIVNETMARRFWSDGNALGRYIRHGKAPIEVVGIVRDAKYRTLAETAQPFVYLPLAQEPSSNLTLSLAVRTSGDPMLLAPAIEREVKALMPNWPMFQFRTLDEGLKLQQALPGVGASILGSLGAFGLLLAAIGLYGVMAYVVRQRTHEIGIRLAIGAQIRDVIALIVKQGMAVCAAGGAIGMVIAFVAAQFLDSVLYGISASDPITFITVPLVLIGVALLACYLPARQAAGVDVLRALRRE